MFDPTSLAKEIFNVLRSFNYTVNIFDFDGARVYEPADARRFFASPRNITVSIFDDGENSSIKMFLSQSTTVAEVEGLIETMRNTASKFGVLFNVRKYQRELVPKDLSPNSHLETEAGVSVVNAGNDKEVKNEIVHLDDIKSELKQLRDEFPEVLAHLRANKKNKKEKVKENMNEDATLEEKKGPPMMELPALGCSVEIAEWNEFKDGSLKLYSAPEGFSDEQIPDEKSGMVLKLKAIADKTVADGMANMFSRVADAIEHGAKDKILFVIAKRAIHLAYSKLEEDCWDGYKMVGMKKKGKKNVPNCVPEDKVNEEALNEKRGPDMVHLPALGFDVEEDAWEDLKQGKLDLSRPVSFNHELGADANPQAFYLRQISDVCAADGLSIMFARIADDIDAGDKSKLKLHVANVAIAAAKSGGQANLNEAVEHNGVGAEELDAAGLDKTSKSGPMKTEYRYTRDGGLVATVVAETGLVNKAIDMVKGHKAYPFTATLANSPRGKSTKECTSLYAAETWIIDMTSAKNEALIMSESIRNFGEWFDSMSTVAIFEALGDSMEPNESRIRSYISNDDMESAMDIAYKSVEENFDPQDFLDSDKDIDFNNPGLSDEEKNLDCADVQSSLEYYLQQELDQMLDNEYTSESEVKGLAETLIPQVVEVMTAAGWVIDNCEAKIEENVEEEAEVEEDCELATEDVLLPKDPKADLTREVQARNDDGERDADVDRILSLAKGKTL